MKQHIHITLVGGQPVPIYVGIASTAEIDQLVMIHSKQTAKEALQVAEVAKISEPILKEWSSHNFRLINEAAQRLFEDYCDHRVTLNLTSGPKPWALALRSAFAQHKNVQFLYVDQNNVITNIDTYDAKQGEEVSIEKRFHLHGTRLLKYRTLDKYTSGDAKCAERMEEFYRLNSTAIYNLTSIDVDDKLCGTQRYVDSASREHKISWDQIDNWIEICFFDWKGRRVQERFTNRHAFELVFNFAWFELKTALALSLDEKVKQVWVSCVFNAKNSGTAKNEIDVVADMGTKLVFAECKTRVYDSTDLDKFARAITNYSGLGNKGIVVILRNCKTQASQDKLEEKCRDNKLLLFNFQKWYKNGKPNDESLNALVNGDLLTQNAR